MCFLSALFRVQPLVTWDNLIISWWNRFSRICHCVHLLPALINLLQEDTLKLFCLCCYPNDSYQTLKLAPWIRKRYMRLETCSHAQSNRLYRTYSSACCTTIFENHCPADKFATRSTKEQLLCKAMPPRLDSFTTYELVLTHLFAFTIPPLLAAARKVAGLFEILPLEVVWHQICAPSLCLHSGWWLAYSSLETPATDTCSVHSAEDQQITRLVPNTPSTLAETCNVSLWLLSAV